MHHSLNILLVADVSIAKVIGGAERVLSEESIRLAGRGHNVHVLTRRLPHHSSAMEKIDGVEEYRYNFQEKPFPLLFKSIFSDCKQRFCSLQKTSDFHILNCHQPFSALGVLLSSTGRRIPMIYTCHSLSFEEYISRTPPPTSPKEWLHQRLQVTGRKMTESIFLRRSDRIVVLSEYTREKLERTYGISSSKVSVIPGGVDLERFRPHAGKGPLRNRLGIPRNQFVLFTVRNLVPRMGLEALIASFTVARSQCEDLFLVVGGEGPLAQHLREQVERNGIANSVRFVGFIPDESLPSYYQMADLFILPTKELEGFGLVTVEALASGLPVLGTPVGGTKEILAKLGSDFLFNDSTPESITEAILKAMNLWGKNKAVYKNIAEVCRTVAEKYYSWDSHVSRLEHLFFSLATN